jgi:hypothetical protein
MQVGIFIYNRKAHKNWNRRGVLKRTAAVSFFPKPKAGFLFG